MIDLSTEFAGINFKNPVVAAAGPITSTPYTIKRCIENGAGGVVVKSVCLDDETQILPRPGNWFLDRLGERGALMHFWAGLLSQEQAVEYIDAVKASASNENARVIASFFFIGRWTGIPPFESTSPDAGLSLRRMALELEAAGAEAVEIVCTCGLTMNPTDTVAFVERAIPIVYKALTGYLRIPFWLKLGFGHEVFWLRDLDAIQALGATAIHAYSDFRVTYLDIEKAKPPLSLPFGYGRWLRGLLNHAVYLSARKTNLQVMSSGGIRSWRDAVERMMCGATLVALETAVQHRGYKVFGEILDGLPGFMERYGYKECSDMVGSALPHIDNPEEFMTAFVQSAVPATSISIAIDGEKCNRCGLCASCIYGALAMENGQPEINPELCERCGACITICPKAAISLEAQSSIWKAWPDGS